jgi:hypothetical protein
MLAYLPIKQMIRPVIPTDLGLANAVWTRSGHGGQVFGQEGGHGGLGRRRYMRKDFTNLCQKSWDALQAAGGAL